MISSLLAWLRHLRFLQLTLFFVIVLLSLPFRTDHPFFNIVFQLLLINALVVTLSASGSTRILRWLMLGLWALGEGLYLRLLFVLGPHPPRQDVVIVAICFLLMEVVLVTAILPYIYQTRRVTLDTIFAAVMAYFLISCIFANLYSLIYLGNNQAYNLTLTPAPDMFYSTYTEMMYFSLVTIVGVGYGDIVPLLPFPRMLAAMEGVLGHFYIAVFVAWLVGTFISQSLQSSEQQAAKEQQEPIDN
jgi:voltage-gated potassium channel